MIAEYLRDKLFLKLHLGEVFLYIKERWKNTHLVDTRLLTKKDQAGVLCNKMAYIFAITYRKTAETMNSMNERGRKTYFRSKEYYLVKVMNCDPLHSIA